MGKEDGAKRLRKTYADEASAKRAAVAERARLKRAPATLDMKLALGRPDIYPEQRAAVKGIKSSIDGTWLVSEVTHSLDKSGGLTSTIKFEIAT